MKKYLAIILALVMALCLLAGCGSTTTGSDATTAAAEEKVTEAASGGAEVTTEAEVEETEADIDYDKEINVGTQTDPGSLYPGGTTNSAVKMTHQLLFETLFWLDEDQNLCPMVGKDWEDLGNGKYSVEIFDYVYDSAGNHITADDVVFSIKWFIEDGQNVSTTATLKDYKKTGDYTVELQFEPEVVGQFDTLCDTIFIISEKAWNDSPDGMATTPVGTGTYSLGDYIMGSSYTFNRRDDYWQTDEEYICLQNSGIVKTLNLQVITDTTTLAEALETGQIDFSVDILATDRILFADEEGNPLDGWTKGEGANNAFVHLCYNCGPDSPLQNIKLRQAICYAIDAEACCINTQGAYGKVCTMTSNPGLRDVTEDMGHDDYWPYDPEKAKELIKESGYAGETIRILVCPATQVSGCAPLIKQYLAEVGIECELLIYDFAQYRTLKIDETGLEYDAELLGVTASDDFVFRSLVELDVNSYSNGKNHCYIYDEKLQSLYDDAKGVSTNSPETVKALLDYVEEQCYEYGLYYGPKIYFANASKITSIPTGTQDVPIYEALN